MEPVAALLSVLLVLLGGWAFVATAAHLGGAWSSAGNAEAAGQGFGGMMGGGGANGAGVAGGYGMMGGGAGGGASFSGMMGGGQNARLPFYSRTQLAQLIRQGRNGAVINRRSDTVSYSGGSVTLVALASPHGEPNMSWEIDGLVNPTVRVPAGASVRVVLVNTDWGYMHGFELTTTPPPYSFMAMMHLNDEFLLMPLPERTEQSLSTARYPVRSRWLHLGSGTYHYLCPVPGHAEQGMYGTLKVA